MLQMATSSWCMSEVLPVHFAQARGWLPPLSIEQRAASRRAPPVRRRWKPRMMRPLEDGSVLAALTDGRGWEVRGNLDH